MSDIKSTQTGVLDKDWARKRKIKKSWQYRLKRRTHEIIESIYKYHPDRVDSILDIGTSEGAMLSLIKKQFPYVRCVGLEYSQELIEMNKDEDIKIVQGDAQDLPFEDNSFDVAIATAVIEHVSEPAKMLFEAFRILKPGGILMVTTPDPFFDQIFEKITRLDVGHQKTFNLKQLKNLFQKTGFNVLKAEKFMMSPFGFPQELKIEKLIKLLKLDFVLLNQLIVGKKI